MDEVQVSISYETLEQFWTRDVVVARDEVSLNRLLAVVPAEGKQLICWARPRGNCPEFDAWIRIPVDAMLRCVFSDVYLKGATCFEVNFRYPGSPSPNHTPRMSQMKTDPFMLEVLKPGDPNTLVVADDKYSVVVDAEKLLYVVKHQLVEGKQFNHIVLEAFSNNGWTIQILLTNSVWVACLLRNHCKADEFISLLVSLCSSISERAHNSNNPATVTDLYEARGIGNGNNHS